MKNNNKHVFFLILLLIVLNLSSIIHMFNKNKAIIESFEIIELLKNTIISQEKIISAKSFIERNQIFNNYCNISLDSLAIIDKPVLVFRFSTEACNSCVDSILKIISKVEEGYKEDIMIISDHINQRELFVRLKSFGLNNSNYSISNKVPIHFDNLKIPYFFVYDKNCINMFFIPDNEDAKRTVDYIEYVLSSYLDHHQYFNELANINLSLARI